MFGVKNLTSNVYFSVSLLHFLVILNLVKFEKLFFSVDLHFSIRRSKWTSVIFFPLTPFYVSGSIHPTEMTCSFFCVRFDTF